MDEPFAWLTILASYPLRRGYEHGPPAESCSGTIVDYAGHRALLSVAHSVKPNEAWAIELQYEGSAGTKLWKLGTMNYMAVVESEVARPVDFAFTLVPLDVRARWQHFSEHGTLVAEEERLILRSDFSVIPRPEVKYGFAGLTKHTAEPAPPGNSHAISGADLRVETSLKYRDTVEGMDRYDLGHAHPGHEYYRGCSGAPVLSEDGDLVGLVVSGCESDATIRALPLRHYSSALAAAFSQGV